MTLAFASTKPRPAPLDVPPCGHGKGVRTLRTLCCGERAALRARAAA